MYQRGVYRRPLMEPATDADGRAVADGRSPAIKKQRQKRRLLDARSFGEFGEKRADRTAHGGQYASDAVDLRTRVATRVTEQTFDGDHAR